MSEKQVRDREWQRLEKQLESMDKNFNKRLDEVYNELKNISQILNDHHTEKEIQKKDIDGLGKRVSNCEKEISELKNNINEGQKRQDEIIEQNDRKISFVWKLGSIFGALLLALIPVIVKFVT